MDKLTNPTQFIKYIEDELENANHHSEREIPRNLYNRLKYLVKPEDKLDLARIIAEEFYNSI